MIEFGFDGKGVNDYAAKYKPRIATLTEYGQAINAGPLLAAAPDLLAALELLVWGRADEWNPGTASLSDVVERIELARAAIAKAKGQ